MGIFGTGFVLRILIKLQNIKILEIDRFKVKTHFLVPTNLDTEKKISP